MIFKHSEQPLGRRPWSSKFLFLGLILMCALVASSVYKEKKKQNKVAQNISALESEMAKLEKKNNELVELIDYLKSDDFIEKEAREKLNMKQPGEKIVLVSKQEIVAEQVAGAAIGSEKPNWQKWRDYFFGE